MIEVKTYAIAKQIIEADINCKQTKCKDCFINAITLKTTDLCQDVINKAEQYILDLLKELQNRQNRQP